MAKQISYTVRDFQNIRTELINYVKSYYPDLLQNANDASVFSVFLDLNAAVADNLNFNIDRALQETVLQYAQQRSSVYNIARTYGLKIPGLRPSVAICEFSITVPALGDGPDDSYSGKLRRGSQFAGAGQVFENIYDIDFATNFSNDGVTSRRVIPNKDVNNNIINYTITKREPIVNGITKVFRRVINNNDSRPFFELFLPEKNVIGITSVLIKPGTNYANVPSFQEFLGSQNRWYEVDALAQDRIFVEDPSRTSDNPGLKVGKYLMTNTRFISEYTPEGFLKITFGGGSQSTDEILREFARSGQPLDLSKYQNNFSLGSTIPPNSTLFVQYRIGGGLGTNLGVNVINQIGQINFEVNGQSQTINTSVINSLNCTNPFPAIGGANLPTVEEVRNLVGFNFSSQNRAVTINDYEAILRKMPSQFGAPAKVAILETDNKISVSVLTYDELGNLSNTVSQTLLDNISVYLSNYRMINDYVVVSAANVIDLSFDLSIILDSSQNQGIVITDVVNTITSFMSPTNREMGQPLYISEIKRLVQSLNGVLSISSLSVFNKVGGLYSSSQVSQSYSNDVTKQIALVNDTIYAEPNQIFQLRYPNVDVLVRTLNSQTVNIS
jgi:hypothetical protein